MKYDVMVNIALYAMKVLEVEASDAQNAQNIAMALIGANPPMAGFEIFESEIYHLEARPSQEDDETDEEDNEPDKEQQQQSEH
jgi:hypothetical protein